jgi:hypothetical protein
MPSGAQGKIGTPHLLNQSVETNKGVEHTLRSLWILGDDDLDDEDLRGSNSKTASTST